MQAGACKESRFFLRYPRCTGKPCGIHITPLSSGFPNVPINMTLLPSLRQRSPWSLRRLLLVSMLLLLGAAVGTVLLMTQRVAGDALEAAAVDDLRATATLARDRLDQEMHERFRDVTHAAASLQGVNDPGLVRGRAVVNSLSQDYPDYSWVAVVDPQGIVKIGTKGMLEGQSVAQRPWFPAGLKAPFVGDVHEAVLLAKLMGPSANQQPWRFVDFAAPLTDAAGQVVGVFGAHLNWDWANNILRGFERHPESAHGRHVLILDKNGMVLYGPQALRGTHFDLPAPADTQPAWKVDDQWLLTAVPSLGYRNYPGLGWTVVMRESLDLVLAPAQQMQRAILAWSLPMLAIFLLVAFFIGRWLARPLEALSAAAGTDQFLPVMQGGYREILELNESLRGMLGRLAGRKAEVEREVQARTAEVMHLTEALDAHAIVSMADAAGNITYVNEKFCAISGYSEAELLGCNHRIVKSDVHAPEFYQDLWQTIEAGRSWQGQVCNRKKDGSIYWVQSTITPTRIESATDHRYISIRTDITEVIHEQEARRAAEQAADRANRTKSEFLSNMSHELRTPLNAILGFAQILDGSKKHPLDEKQKEHVRQILRGGQHLLDLINEVLDLARIEAGKLSLSMEPIELTSLIDECLGVVQAQAQRQGITLVAPAWTQPALTVLADRIRLKQILLNLLSNAIKYNRLQGTVTVLVTPMAGERVRIAVQDTGLGIAQAQQADLFKPFCRLGAEGSEVEGTGIGLTITRSLTQAMGGTIGFGSEAGQGSIFWVDFALGVVAGLPYQTPPQEGGSVQAATPHAKIRQLLYVEDNPSNVRLLESIIEEVPGLALVSVPNAELGLDLAEREPPDLILMDINLPGMNGIEAVRRLKNHDRTRDIPVLALSADAMPATIREAREAGCLDYLTKPIDIALLLRAIELALKEHAHD